MSEKSEKSEKRIAKSAIKEDDSIKNSTSDEFSDTADNDLLKTKKAFVVVGNVDAGKSTLIGTLTTGVLDNGRGSARETVARHRHEIEAGKTSDVSTRVLKFPNGKITTLIDLCGHEKYFTTTASGISGMWPDYGVIVISPSRGILPMTKQHFRMLMSYNIPVFFVVTRIDVSLEQSCSLVDRDIKKLCKDYRREPEFLNSYNDYHSYKRGSELCNKHNLTDLTDLTEIDDETVDRLGLSDKEVKDIELYLNFDSLKLTHTNQITQGLNMAAGRQAYIPVVYMSNVNGYYLDVVKNSMMHVEPRDLWRNDENANSIVKFFRRKLNIPTLGMEDNHKGSTFYIDNSYNVKGVGLVISGINRGDQIKANDVLLLGPINKSFIKVKLKSMHNDNRTDIGTMDNHDRGCIAIKPLKDDIKKSAIKKGMVLISDPAMISYVGYRFEAAVTIFGTHSATLRTGYSPVVHAGTIRQTAKMILPDEKMTDEEIEQLSGFTKRERKNKAQRKIKAGDIERVTFKFRIKPEYIEPGTVFVFRSGDIHGVGCVVSTLELSKDSDAQPEPIKRKYRRIRPSDKKKQEESVTKKIQKVIVS